MKTILTILFFVFAGTFIAEAQEVKRPIPPQEIVDTIPPSPGEGLVWIKAHWNWQGNEYVWVKGAFVVPPKENHNWVDGHWERNQKTGWWVYNDGHWVQAARSVFITNKKDIESAEETTTIKSDSVEEYNPISTGSITVTE